MVSTVVLAVTSLLFVWVGAIACARSSKAARLVAASVVLAVALVVSSL
jgi:hypothetical protein